MDLLFTLAVLAIFGVAVNGLFLIMFWREVVKLKELITSLD